MIRQAASTTGHALPVCSASVPGACHCCCDQSWVSRRMHCVGNSSSSRAGEASLAGHAGWEAEKVYQCCTTVLQSQAVPCLGGAGV